MAMIPCPNCGQSISEKACICPKCGATLEKEDRVKKFCPECNVEIEDGVTTCPNCGCPINNERNEPKNTLPTLSPKIKRIILGGIASVFAIIVVVLLVRSINHKQLQKEQLQLSNDYAENISTTIATMYEGASKAEDLGGQIHDVWYNTIFEVDDPSTNQFTKTNGSFNSDFNKSLSLLFNNIQFNSKMKAVQSNRDTVDDLMKRMTNPPSEYEAAYDDLKDLYDAYVEMINLVLNPAGNLQTFTESFNSADSNVASKISAMSIYTD